LTDKLKEEVNMARRSRKRNISFVTKLKNFATHSKSLPFIVIFSILGILFVVIRMKGIEQDYKLNEIQKLVRIHKIKNKELKAIKAKELSVKKLKAYAQKFDLSEPDEKRIIVIP
tara:strand:+ start:2491 stop:2835 length:345 start_codon:yes stop_codon:yes gene_type:complete